MLESDSPIKQLRLLILSSLLLLTACWEVRQRHLPNNDLLTVLVYENKRSGKGQLIGYQGQLQRSIQRGAARRENQDGSPRTDS